MASAVTAVSEENHETDSTRHKNSPKERNDSQTVKSYSSRFLDCSITRNLDLSYLDTSHNQAHRVLTVCNTLDFILSLSF